MDVSDSGAIIQPNRTSSMTGAIRYGTIVDAVNADMKTPASARVYGQTYRAWEAFCEAQDVNPLNLSPEHVRAFLLSKDTTKTTRARQLSALRKLAAKAHTYALLMAPEDAHIFEALRKLLDDMKAPAASEVAKQNERAKRALTPAQADKLLRVWNGGKLRDLRNRALVAVLLLTGMRRAEAAGLMWRDVDLAHGIISVRHGKGDKAREVPIAGEFALDALATWREALRNDSVYVFPPLRKGDRLADDRPISGTDVYRTVKQTEKLAGVAFSPHDCRRTFITEALQTGTTVRDVQGIAGHARAETTLHYAQKTEAREVRKKLKLRYG